MASLKALRNQLGLSQPAFADLLHCSPGQLSMAESGLRSVPAASLATVAALDKALTAAKATKPVSKAPDEKIIALLHKHIRKCKVQVETMEITILKLSEKLEAAKRILSLPTALATLSSANYVDDVQLQMNLLQRKAAKKAKEYAEKLIQLQLSVAGLQAQMAKAAELISGQHN